MMKFMRPFSTFSVVLKEAKVVAKTGSKATKASKAAATKAATYKPTKEDRHKSGKLNKGELKRLFETDGVLNYDKVRLLRRHVLYESQKGNEPAYVRWVSEQMKTRPGSPKVWEIAQEYKQKTDTEKAEIAQKFAHSSTSTNPFQKFDYKMIKNPKLSGLNVYLAESLKDQKRVFEEGKMKAVIGQWSELSDSEKQVWVDKANELNKKALAQLEEIWNEAKTVYTNSESH